MAAEVSPDEWIRILDTQLRMYLNVEPEHLTDDEWAARIRELEYIRIQEAKQAKGE